VASTVGGSYSWNVICPVCGFKHKGQNMKKRWDGPWVCKDCWEPRHPLDFYRTRNDFHKLPFTYPDGGIDVGPLAPGAGFACTVFRAAPLADQGTADCARLTV